MHTIGNYYNVYKNSISLINMQYKQQIRGHSLTPTVTWCLWPYVIELLNFLIFRLASYKIIHVMQSVMTHPSSAAGKNTTPFLKQPIDSLMSDTRQIVKKLGWSLSHDLSFSIIAVIRNMMN